MYVLVAILFLSQQHYRIDPAPILFPNYAMCMEARSMLFENLMAARPSPESFVITYCSEVPTGV